MKAIGAILWFLFVALTSAAQAEPGSVYFKTGNALALDCKIASSTSSCLAYILRMVDGNGDISGKDSLAVCLPKNGFSAGQAEAVFKKYLSDHPEQLHLPASDLITFAMIQAFPCFGNTK